MNFIKRFLASALTLFMISSLLCVSAFAETSELGTKENPENANDNYFSAAKCYLLNTDLLAGDSDGYWYIYTATGSGITVIDAIGKTPSGADTDDYQVTVECNGITYYAFDKVFTRPITPFKVSRGDVITVHMSAKADKNGNYPALKIYCNITSVYGTESSPVLVKSESGFTANIQAQKMIVYQDGTNGGLYGGKGITVSAEGNATDNTEVILNGVTYIDLDGDGKIELTLPGDPTAQLPNHPIFSIYNGNKSDVSYTVNIVDSAFEGPGNHTSSHALTYVKAQSACHYNGMKEYWYCSICDAYFSDSNGKNVTCKRLLEVAPTKKPEHIESVLPTCSAYGMTEYWYCNMCNSYFADEGCKIELDYEELQITKLPHSFGEAKIIKESTFTEHGILEKICSECGEKELEALPLMERYKKGDIDNNGKINSIDSYLLKCAIVGLLSSVQERDAADFNDDGNVNPVDSYMVKLIVAGSNT